MQLLMTALVHSLDESSSLTAEREWQNKGIQTELLSTETHIPIVSGKEEI